MDSGISQNNTGNSKYMRCIVVPVYKDKLSEFEIKSLKRCCVILGKYPIIFVTHNKLDCTVYNVICEENHISCKYEYFNKRYFSDVSCYNALLLSKKFYARFSDYEYMLIYQLDAYVFKDELEYWCKKGYDYIGAPWLRLNKSKTMPEFCDSPAVGNGGFSLRNIKKIVTVHSIKMSMVSFIHLFQSYYNKISFKAQKYFLYFVPRIFLRSVLKVLKFAFSEHDNLDNEDVKWSELLQKKGKVPSAIEAIKFSFENFPEYIYQLNNEKLPFGCHDWSKYYNYIFYKKYII
jgi:hypothetical protein